LDIRVHVSVVNVEDAVVARELGVREAMGLIRYRLDPPHGVPNGNTHQPHER
jgi:hypothetical protein